MQATLPLLKPEASDRALHVRPQIPQSQTARSSSWEHSKRVGLLKLLRVASAYFLGIEEGEGGWKGGCRQLRGWQPGRPRCKSWSCSVYVRRVRCFRRETLRDAQQASRRPRADQLRRCRVTIESRINVLTTVRSQVLNRFPF